MSFTYLKSHFVLFFISIVSAFALLPLLEMSAGYVLKYKSFFNAKSVKGALIFCAILFLFFGYLTKPVYYSPKTIGTIGDDYFQMAEAVKKKGILQAQHIMKPYLTEKFLILSEKIGILHANDPDYLEKSVIVASFPIRALTVLGLLCIFFIGYVYFDSFYVGLMFLFFIGTSFVVWAWGISHNSIGSAIAMTMISYFSAIWFFKDPSLFRAFLFGVITSLCVFTHSSIGYFCLGIFLYMVYWVAQRDEVPNKIKMKYFLFFCIGVSLITLMYYYTLASYYGTWNILNLINAISDGGYRTNVLSVASLKKFYSSFMQFGVNLSNRWRPGNLFEKILILLQISGLTAALIVTIRNVKYCGLKKHINFLLLFIFPFIAVIFGFLFLVYEYYHYLDVGSVSLFLLLLFIFFLCNRDPKQRVKIVLSLCIVALSFFLFNAFSRQNIFAYRNIHAIPIYSNYNVIYQHMVGRQHSKAVFLTYDEYQPYFYRGVYTYYQKFSTIERLTDFPRNMDAFSSYANKLITDYGVIYIDSVILGEIRECIDHDSLEISNISERIYVIERHNPA